MKLCGEFPQKALEAMSLAISMQVLVKGAAALLAARKWQALRVSKLKLKVHWLSIGSGLNGSKSNQQSLGLHSSDSSHLFYFYLILLDILLKKQRCTMKSQWINLLLRDLALNHQRREVFGCTCCTENWRELSTVRQVVTEILSWNLESW